MRLIAKQFAFVIVLGCIMVKLIYDSYHLRST